MSSLMLDVAGVTEATLINLRNMPDEIAAVALDGRLRALEIQWKRSFLERGVLLLEMEQRMLWRKLDDPSTGEPYTSLERWILTAAPQSRSDAYAALRAVKELRDIPRQHLEGVARCNVAILQALSTSIRNEPEVLKAAKDLPEREFIRKIEKDYPDQHIESRRLIHLHPTKSASAVIEKAIKLAMQLEGLTTREQVLESWAVTYLQEHTDEETGTADRSAS
jgi:hypothetical protein